jgi:thiol-disulfide isomerase/thioredoxin
MTQVNEVWRVRRSVSVVAASVLVIALAACGGAPAGDSRPGSTASLAGPASAAAEVSPGAWLLTFKGTTVDGKPFDGASLAGKPTVLWFWAPWCPTCLMQAPGVRTALQRSSAGVNIVGVAGLDKAKAMPDFVRMAKVGSMTHVGDEAGVVWKRFGIIEQSYLVMLDSSGKEVFRGKLAPDDIPTRVAALTD